MNPLPAGWTLKSLGDVAHVVRGVTYKKEAARSSAAVGHVPLIRATNIGDRLDLANGLVYVPRTVVKDAQLLRPGDTVLAASSGSVSVVGKSAILDAPWSGTFGAFCAVLRPREPIDAKFLAHYVRSDSVRRRWSEAARGTNINNLKAVDLTSTPFPVPPLEEQRRIVDILEEHLSRLETGVGAIQHVRRRLGLLRAARLSSLMRSAGEVTRLGSVADAVSGPAFRSSNFGGVGDGIRLLRGDNIVPGSLRWDRTRTWPESLLPGYEHLLLDPDDVIIAMDRPMISAGLKLAIVENADTPALLVQRVARLRAREAILPRYLYLALQAPEFSRHLRLDQVGTQIPHITLEGIRSFQFPLPTLGEQSRALETLAEELSLVQQVDATLLALTRRAAALTKALLAAAFSGRLTGAPSDLDWVEELAGV